MSRKLKRDDYTRPPKPVIRFTLGGSHQDPPEVTIEISGHAREEWGRKIQAADEVKAALADSLRFIVAEELREGLPNPYHLIAEIRDALALLDGPTTEPK